MVHRYRPQLSVSTETVVLMLINVVQMHCRNASNKEYSMKASLSIATNQTILVLSPRNEEQ